MQEHLTQAEVISIAEDCGLLTISEQFPKSLPAQQRLISRLMQFAEKVIRSSEVKESE